MSHMRRGRSFGWLIALGLIAAATVVWASFGQTLARAKPLPVANVPAPNAVVWHGRVYQSRSSLAHALSRSGRSYAAWARSHPRAAALLAARAAGRSR